MKSDLLVAVYIIAAVAIFAVTGTIIITLTMCIALFCLGFYLYVIRDCVVNAKERSRQIAP